MNGSTDPVSLLPLAVAGIVVGATLSLGSGYALHLQWSVQAEPTDSAHTTLKGTVEWAGWRASAVPTGPNWYLEIRLAGRPRGFLIPSRRLSEAIKSRFSGPRPDEAIPALTGQEATVVVDSTLLARAERHPSLAALRVNGERIVGPKNDRSEGSASSARWGLGLLFGLGIVVGVGLFGACLQHVVVCVRRRGAWQ